MTHNRSSGHSTSITRAPRLHPDGADSRHVMRICVLRRTRPQQGTSSSPSKSRLFPTAIPLHAAGSVVHISTTTVGGLQRNYTRKLTRQPQAGDILHTLLSATDCHCPTSPSTIVQHHPRGTHASYFSCKSRVCNHWGLACRGCRFRSTGFSTNTSPFLFSAVLFFPAPAVCKQAQARLLVF